MPHDGRALDDAVADPDVEFRDTRRRRELKHWDVLVAVAAGGVAGAEARYGLGVALPHTAGQFPWATVVVNASGCLAIGALMVLLLELTNPHRLARPFLGVGVLGGYTTFSTFAVDVRQLAGAGRPWLAVAYIVVTVVACLVAVWLAAAATQRVGEAVIERRRSRR